MRAAAFVSWILCCLTPSGAVNKARAPWNGEGSPPQHASMACPWKQCDPYPGCDPPDVPTQVCPCMYKGDLCGVFERAHAAGVPRGALHVEVGAAFGYGTWIARHYGHPVLAFECRRDEFERLRQQFQSDPLVHLVHACVSNDTGVAQLHRGGGSSSMRRETIPKDQAALDRKRIGGAIESVRTIRLDEYLSLVRVLGQRVGTLSIDTQGNEPRVLHGAVETIQRDHPVIFYEDQFTAAKLRGGALLHSLLGNHELYHCNCEKGGIDCECMPRTTAKHQARIQARKWGDGGR